MKNILKDNQIEYLNSLFNETNFLFKEMELFASENGIPILERYSSKFIQMIIRVKNVREVLEIGMAIGYTTSKMAIAGGENIKIDTMEIGKNNIIMAKQFFSKLKISEKINIIEGDASKLINKLDKKYDLIFLDADKEDYLYYYNKIPELLKKEGILIVDNLLWHGYSAEENPPKGFINSAKYIKEFNRVFVNDYRFESTILSIGDGLGFAIKK